MEKLKTIEIQNANILSVGVYTTGYCGGDAGHGGKTYISLKDIASTYMGVKINGNKYEPFDNHLEIELKGDSELKTFIEALEFILSELKPKAEDTKNIAKIEILGL